MWTSSASRAVCPRRFARRGGFTRWQPHPTSRSSRRTGCRTPDWNLLKEESIARAHAAPQRRLGQAGFPYAATIEQFDFRFRPELKRQVVLRYLDPTFFEQSSDAGADRAMASAFTNGTDVGLEGQH